MGWVLNLQKRRRPFDFLFETFEITKGHFFFYMEYYFLLNVSRVFSFQLAFTLTPFSWRSHHFSCSYFLSVLCRIC